MSVGPYNPETSGRTPFNPLRAIKNSRENIDRAVWKAKPVNVEGIGGFVFDHAAETQLRADSEITDHYTELNSFFNDHVARKPLELTFRGFRGELVLEKPKGLIGRIDQIESKLDQVPAWAGDWTPTQLKKIRALAKRTTDVVNTVDEAIQRAGNIMPFLKGSAPESRVHAAYRDLMALRETAKIFNVDSPFGVISYFDEDAKKAAPRTFVIKTIVLTSPEETNDEVDISITVKEVQFAQAQSEKRIDAGAQGRAKPQRSPLVINGMSSGAETSVTRLPAMFGINEAESA